MKPNIEPLTIPELVALKDEIDVLIAKKQKEARSEAIAKMEAIAKEAGFSVEELLGSAPLKASPVKTKTDRRSVVPPKYRDPASGTTWSGRGVKPKWVAAALASGKTLDDLKIS
jgi:DNA-binding protein H-NS